MFGRLIGSVKDHNCKECCSYFMLKETKRRVLAISFLKFCLCTFTFAVLIEFFSFSFHVFAKIKIRFCDVDALSDPASLSVRIGNCEAT